MTKKLEDLTREELIARINEISTNFEATVEYMNEGCVCGRAPAPKQPVDPRLLAAAPKYNWPA